MRVRMMVVVVKAIIMMAMVVLVVRVVDSFSISHSLSHLLLTTTLGWGYYSYLILHMRKIKLRKAK